MVTDNIRKNLTIEQIRKNFIMVHFRLFIKCTMVLLVCKVSVLPVLAQQLSAGYEVRYFSKNPAAKGESDFDPNARSSANAIGIMGLVRPGGNVNELMDPCKNIAYGAKELRLLMDKYQNNIHLALAAYYCGVRFITIDSPVPNAGIKYNLFIYAQLQKILTKQTDITPKKDS